MRKRSYGIRPRRRPSLDNYAWIAIRARAAVKNAAGNARCAGQADRDAYATCIAGTCPPRTPQPARTAASKSLVRSGACQSRPHHARRTCVARATQSSRGYRFQRSDPTEEARMKPRA